MPRLQTILRSALALCLACAGAVAAAQEATRYNCDVVVVGAGGAGLTAALTAAEAGARVMVLEKMPMIGGNTRQASSYMLAGPDRKTAIGAEETTRELIKAIITEGGGRADPKMVNTVVRNSGDTFDWLLSLGADLDRSWGYFNTREAVGVQPRSGVYTIGEEIIKTLLHGAEIRHIPIQTLSRVDRLTVSDDGQVSGVQVTDENGRVWYVSANAVVLATGGFGADDTMLSQYMTMREGMFSTNMPGATGDGIKMAQALGAKPVQMDAVMIHPTTMPFSGVVLPRSVRVSGGILLNARGQRFTDELSENLSRDIYQKSDGRAWLIVDQQIMDRFPSLSSYARLGYFIRARTQDELARLIRVDPQVLDNTLRRYRTFVGMGRDADYNRATLASRVDHYPLYAVNVRPALQSTLGGLKINQDAQVLDGRGRPIGGLYAAGEVTGGIFGAHRLEGTAITSALVYGRVAGKEAASYALSQRIHDADKHPASLSLHPVEPVSAPADPVRQKPVVP